MPLDRDEKPSANLPPAAKEVKNFSRQFAQAMELPFVLVAAILLGGAIGFFLDRWLHTKPVLMLIMGGFGFVAGVRDVLRRLPKDGA
jgi:F0F1-type ATP synthase assembly protein I